MPVKHAAQSLAQKKCLGNGAIPNPNGSDGAGADPHGSFTEEGPLEQSLHLSG